MAKTETPKKVNKRVIDGDWVKVVARSHKLALDRERQNVKAALRRIESFMSGTGFRDGEPSVMTDDWRNLLTSVALGLEASTRLDMMMNESKTFEAATAEVVDDEGRG